MNTTLIKIIASTIAIVAIGFGGYYGYEWYQDNVTPITNVMTEHDVSTLDTLIASTSDAIIYIGDPSCGDSDEFETWFLADLPSTTWETDYTWEYVSVKSLRENDTFEAFKTQYEITTTPTLVHVVDGKIVDQIAWSLRDGFDQAEVTAWINAQ
ncbi:MAG: thioredoxin family protein [Culicoidibacterales bacterium]